MDGKIPSGDESPALARRELGDALDLAATKMAVLQQRAEGAARFTAPGSLSRLSDRLAPDS